jgi:subtilase family serine protease
MDQHRRRLARRLALAAALVAGVLIGLAPAALAAPADPPPGGTSTTGNVLPGLVKARDLGPAQSEHLMSLLVSVARPDPAGERALLEAEYEPHSDRYRHYLSTTSFADRFGVSPAHLRAVTDWLRGGGLRVAMVSAARDQVAAVGTVARISRLFRTPVHAFDDRGAGFLANTSAPWVPTGLRISNVIGLNTAQRMHSLSGPAQSRCHNGTCLGGTTPGDLWSAYQQSAAFGGRDQRVAIFGGGSTAGIESDLRQFEDHFGLPHVPLQVRHPAGEGDSRDTSGRVEWNLDTQAASGMAPDLSGLDLYFGEDLTDVEVAKVFSLFTDDENGPRQASASFGECEAMPVISPIARLPLLDLGPSFPVQQGLGNNLDLTLTEITRQAVLEGKTVFASSGDTGSSCPVVSLPLVGPGNGVLNQVVALTNSPASLPYVVGVGGTVLYTDGHGHRAREYGWPFGGGGSTQFIPAPRYQRGTPGLTLHCLTDPAQLCRGVPDVSAQSGDIAGNGYDIVTRGRFTDGGGTSLSSPLWAGMWARIQSASDNDGGLGFANYALYRIGTNPATYRRDFFDVSSTDLRTGLPSSNGLYPTLPGWDYVTGFGTPRVASLICDLDDRC